MGALNGFLLWQYCRKHDQPVVMERMTIKIRFPRLCLVIFLLFVVSFSRSSPDRHTTCQNEKSAISGQHITVYRDVNLVPMTVEMVFADQNVLVEGTRIIAIGPANEVAIPEDAKVIEGAGAFLMPGLADMHMHTREDWLSGVWSVSPLKLYIANGVTTIRDFGPSGMSLTYTLRWRDQIKAGDLVGPTLYTSGLQPGHPSAGPFQNPKRIVQENKAQGFDFLKLYSFLSNEEFHEAMTRAKQLDI